MEERRIGFRGKVDFPLRYSPLNSEEIYKAKLKDLSLKGARFDCLSPPSIGEELKLAVNIPGEDNLLDIQGRVVWNSKGEENSSCGILFTRIKDRDKEKISSFISSNFKEELRKVWWQNID